MHDKENKKLTDSPYNNEGNINSSIGFLVKYLGEQIEKDFKKCFEKYDLTMSQVYILRYIRENIDREITQKDIEVYMGVSHPTIVGILQRLEAKGFITTSMVVRKRMAKIITPTKKEEEVYKEILRLFDKSSERIFGKLSKEEGEYLNKILLKICEQ